jgi:hypothetical protein
VGDNGDADMQERKDDDSAFQMTMVAALAVNFRDSKDDWGGGR